MNLLPLVAIFSLLFSAGIYSFFHQSQSLNQERYHVFGALDIDRQCANKRQKAKYLKAEGEAIVHKQSSGQKKSSASHSPRSLTQMYPTQKLNIRKLGMGQPPAKLKNTTVAFIKILYAPTALYKEGMEEEVVEILTTLIKEHPDVATLEALLPYIPEEKAPLFYKLFKGTQNYVLGKASGYPTLTDFIQLGSKTEKPIHISRASKPLLEALLGAPLAEALLAEETKKSEAEGKQKTLTKAEWDTFILTHQLNPADFTDLIDHSKAKGGQVQRRLTAKGQKMQVKSTVEG